MERLPSLWQLGDYVSATFPRTGLLKKCKVIKVAFTEHSEPLYDIDVPFEYYQGDYDPDNPDMPTVGHVRIHGLKEWHLRNPEEPVADRMPTQNGVPRQCPDCGADLQVEIGTGDLKFIKHNT
jgi:hypothetical protein